MELQTLASFSRHPWVVRSRALFANLIHPALIRYSDDALLILALLSASPDTLSLAIGSVLCLWAWILILWQRGYDLRPGQRAIVGPFRFVRYPRLLALWFIALGLSLATRSFPALLYSLSLLPILYHFGINREDRVLEKNDLETYRYQQYVPALVPTLFPYLRPDDGDQPRYSWRRAFFKPDAELKHALVVVLFAWPLLFARLQSWIPSWGLMVAAGAWLLAVLGWEFGRHRHAKVFKGPPKRL
jgi:protein-S-isoprenylcysteine O-methyltransferase Ste14